MDIPALGVDGDCVYVIGQLDESPGVLIFASFDGFQQFLAAGTTDAIGQGPDALGSELLALTFLRAGELPPSMRREAMEHAWPVASADAYPLVERRNPDGTLCRLVEQDIEIATACALSLSALFGKHAAMFKSDNFAPLPAEVRVVLRRRRPGGTVHRALRGVRRLRPDGINRTRPELPGVGDAVPAKGRPQRTLPVRQRTQIQEVPSRPGRGRARQPSGHGADALVG